MAKVEILSGIIKNKSDTGKQKPKKEYMVKGERLKKNNFHIVKFSNCLINSLLLPFSIEGLPFLLQ